MSRLRFYAGIIFEVFWQGLLLICLIVGIGLAVSSCSASHKEPITIIPSSLTHVEFWNGGTLIREYDNVNISPDRRIQTYLAGSVYVIIYHITGDGVDEYIMNSDALTIIYKEAIE
jgi:hypothetical protein